MPISKAKRERQRANRKKKLPGVIYDLPDLTPVNAFRVIDERKKQSAAFNEEKLENCVRYR